LPDINFRQLPTTNDIELPLPTLNASDRVFLGDFPSRAVAAHATDMGDCFVPALAVRFINAANLMSCCHCAPLYSAEHYSASLPTSFSEMSSAASTLALTAPTVLFETFGPSFRFQNVDGLLSSIAMRDSSKLVKHRRSETREEIFT
jgi:hypothetical protein